MFNSKYRHLLTIGPTTTEESTRFRQRDVSSRSNTLSKLSRYHQYSIQLGSSAVGIKVEEGVVLAVERRLNSTLIVPGSIEKIFEVDSHIAVAASGVITDAKSLIEHARV
jgi:20S proteasome alpha/beta subunit